MGIITGLKNIQKHDEEEEARRAQRANKVNWLVVPKNGKVEIIFLQELDESSERYSEKNGLGFLATEHQGQGREHFFKRILCTNDEEHGFECWGCEKNRMEYANAKSREDYDGGWRQHQNFYINVLVRYVDPETGEKKEEVAVLQRRRSSKSFVDQIINEFAVEDGFISNRLFTLSRKGEGFDTVYTLSHRKEDAGVNVEDYELFDLKSLIREVDYAEQPAALGVSVAPPRRDIQDSGSTDPEDDDDDWL